MYVSCLRKQAAKSFTFLDRHAQRTVWWPRQPRMKRAEPLLGALRAWLVAAAAQNDGGRALARGPGDPTGGRAGPRQKDDPHGAKFLH